ncbi:MAG: hypothetical protein E7641_05700 [Ruminococcaceae bacterium]|nr:hypothetical protein [Oscillospiraceae bacterium]
MALILRRRGAFHMLPPRWVYALRRGMPRTSCPIGLSVDGMSVCICGRTVFTSTGLRELFVAAADGKTATADHF